MDSCVACRAIKARLNAEVEQKAPRWAPALLSLVNLCDGRVGASGSRDLRDDRDDREQISIIPRRRRGQQRLSEAESSEPVNIGEGRTACAQLLRVLFFVTTPA